MKKIGLISAIRQEIQPVLKRFPAAVRRQLDNLPAWYFNFGGNPQQLEYLPDKLNKKSGEYLAQCVIVESGIGMTNSSHAASVILESFKPDLILSIGFCGALRTGISIGDLVLAEQLFLHTGGGLQPQTGLQLFPESALRQQPATLYRGTFITTETIVSKASIYPLLENIMPNPVLEMESSAVFRICSNAGIQFAAIRSVSDAADEDPFLLVNHIIGPDFQINRKRALVALIKNPGYLPQLLRLQRSAHLAGESLADAISGLLESLSCG